MNKALVVFVLLYVLGMFVSLGYVFGFGKGYSRALNDVIRSLDTIDASVEV